LGTEQQPQDAEYADSAERRCNSGTKELSLIVEGLGPLYRDLTDRHAGAATLSEFCAICVQRFVAKTQPVPEFPKNPKE
jgi:hypothetical protein